MAAPFLIEFPADDPERARRFWEGLLGRAFEPRQPEDGRGWQAPHDGVTVGVHERGTGPGDRFSLPYFPVGDLQAAVERVKELGGEIVHPGERWVICRDSEGTPFALASPRLMRVFVAGATGVMGVHLVPLLIDAGHTVAGLTRSRPDAVAALGAEPVVCKRLRRRRPHSGRSRVRPDVVVHQLTDLPDAEAGLEAARDANLRTRTEGTRNLLAAAGDVKTVAQSTAFPALVEEHERLVLEAGGVLAALRLLVRPGHLVRGHAAARAAHPHRRGGAPNGRGARRAARLDSRPGRSALTATRRGRDQPAEHLHPAAQP